MTKSISRTWTWCRPPTLSPSGCSVRKWQPSWISLFKPSTPFGRRVIGLADQQSDLTEDFKGPSKKIAKLQMVTIKSSSRIRPWKGLTVDDIEFREVKALRDEAQRPAKKSWLAFRNCLLLTFPCQHALG